jgi:predicted chitinase
MSGQEVTPETPSVEPENPVSAPFQFPLRKPNGSHYTSAEALHTALQAENSGHYLLGSNGFWHGGIHITDASAPQCVRDEPLRAIADGVVVAYRINRDHLVSNLLGSELRYSSSFVLIRHDYHSPANTEEGPDKGKQNSLTFYSLYMHLLPWSLYDKSTDLASNPFIKFEVGDYLARSALKSDPDCIEYGRIPTGSVFEILEESASVNDITYAKGKLISGTINNLPPGKEAWFTYKKSGAPLKNRATKDIWSPVNRPERQTPGYWQGTVRAQVCLRDGLPLYFPPTTPIHGAQAGIPMVWDEQFRLCWTSDIEFDSRKILNLQLNGQSVRMAECRFIDTGNGNGLLANNRMRPERFWAVVENEGDGTVATWLSVEPAEFDKVVLCEHPIKAGDPVGYLGLYEIPANAAGAKLTKHQVHMEVFSADERLDAFLQNKAGLKQGKQYLSLPANTRLNGQPPNTEHITLTTSHIVEMSKVKTFKDPQNMEWYEVSIKENGQQVSGLLRKDAVNSNLIASPQIISQHDLQKLGYRKVEEHNPDADGYLDPDDMPHFFQDIHQAIDTNQDGSINAEELATALKNPILRNKWSRLIARHCNEWKGGSEAPRFAIYQRMMQDHPEALAHLKERMDLMKFWDEVAEAVGLPVDGRVWHFHPVEVMGIFNEQLCACNRDISLHEINVIVTSEQLTEGIFNKSIHDEVNGVDVEFFLVMLNQSMEKFGITECLDKAFFLANIAVECDRFKTTEEYANKDGSIPTHWQNYRGGPEYHGRGLIQLTHVDNYESYFRSEKISKNTPVAEVAKNLRFITGSAGWYWRKGSAWGDISDFSKNNDFVKVIIGVNGGFNHAYERELYALDLIKKLNVSSCHIHGKKAYRKYRFSESSLAKSSVGLSIWRRYFGESDEFFKQ